MGRFELIVGEERNGFPIYKQAHSKGMLEKKRDTLLYRYVGDSPLNLNHCYFHQVWKGLAG